MYIALGQKQTTLCGQSSDVNRKPLSLCPFVANFQKISLKSDFIHKAIKKKVLDSQAPPRLPKRLRIDPFFCVEKKKKISASKKKFVLLKYINP